MEDKCLCCDLKSGIITWGIVVLIGNLLICGFIINLLASGASPQRMGAIFWVIVGIVVFFIFWTLLRTVFMVKGVGMEKPKMVRRFVVMLYVEIAFQIIGGIGQIMKNPVSLVGTIVGLSIAWYNLRCVKSYETKLLVRTTVPPQCEAKEFNALDVYNC